MLATVDINLWTNVPLSLSHRTHFYNQNSIGIYLNLTPLKTKFNRVGNAAAL